MGWRVCTDTSSGSSSTPADDSQEGTATASPLLPTFKKGNQDRDTPTLTEKQTTPPKHYTEASLLRAMETAGKFVEDETLRAAMKENGIGTPFITMQELLKRSLNAIIFVVKERT